MKKIIAAFILIPSLFFLAGCQERYDPSIHEDLIHDIRNEIGDGLSGKLENPVSVEIMDSKHDYEDRGKINDYRIVIHIKDIDERNGELYTKQECWNILHKVDQIVSNNRLAGAGTASEGAYNFVTFYFGDDPIPSDFLDLKFFGNPKNTYQNFMTDDFDSNGNPIYNGKIQDEHVDEWIHQ